MIAVMRSDVHEAGTLLEQIREVMRRLPEEEKPFHQWHREMGLLAKTMGRLDEAVQHLEDAANRPSAASHERAWAMHELAATLAQRGRSGDSRRAGTLWQEALRESFRLRLKPLEQRIRESMETAAMPSGKREPWTDDSGGLSLREIEVVRLVAKGLTNKEIGDKLFITTKTVEAHMRNILEKTGMANRTEMTAYAIRIGLAE